MARQRPTMIQRLVALLDGCGGAVRLSASCSFACAVIGSEVVPDGFAKGGTAGAVGGEARAIVRIPSLVSHGSIFLSSSGESGPFPHRSKTAFAAPTDARPPQLSSTP